MRRLFVYVVAPLSILALGAWIWWSRAAPVVDIDADRPGVGRAGTTVAVSVREPVRGVTSVRVESIHADRTTLLAEQALPPPSRWALWRRGRVDVELPVELSEATVEGLSEGTLTLRVTAAGTGAALLGPRTVVRDTTFPVRLRPPTVGVTSTQNYAAQGGSGVVVYRVSETALERGARDGVQAGAWFFPGRPLPEGGAGDRFALYGVPYDLSERDDIRLIAEDALGNSAPVVFLDRFFPRPLKTDTIHLSVAFMQETVPEILAHTPEISERGDLLASYLAINGELREQNAESLRGLGMQSRDDFLWSGAFDQLPNSQVTSAFADRRTYVLDGRNVDRQDHLGFDLASVRSAPVPASNRGVVVLADYFGIYGNTVVLDHGGGLMSLYSHLSAIDVTAGQEVERAQVLGRTGQTGLAGGDHLHFTLLVRGLPVNPIEWWDPAWVRDRILSKLLPPSADAVERP